MRIKYRIEVMYHSESFYYTNICIFKEFKSHINNKLNGELKSYWNDGNVSLFCHYKDGKLNGEYIAYCMDGSIYQHSLYKNGNRIKKVK